MSTDDLEGFSFTYQLGDGPKVKHTVTSSRKEVVDGEEVQVLKAQEEIVDDGGAKP